VTSPAPDDKLVGTALDEAYLLTHLISEGGMGTVFEAIQLHLRKRVAVKIMVPELAANPEALARFRREVEVTSQLAHPHVIQLLDFGTAPTGQPYLVMEYLDGEDLSQRLARVGRLPLAAAVDVIRQIASALAVIHAKGIVHRDLKPGNVFLLPREGISDFVKVVDFGISKVKSSSTKLTRAFTMVGTPECMSPEQATAQGDEVDHRSDQWALACVAWQMLGGTMPFRGTSLNDLLERIVTSEPPALAPQVPGLPAAVEQVLRRALSKRKDDRFPTVGAFARALETAAGMASTVPAVMPAHLPSPTAGPATPATLESPAPSFASAPALILPAALDVPAPPPPGRTRGPSFLLAGVAMIALTVGGVVAYRANEPRLLRLLDRMGLTPAATAAPKPAAPLRLPHH
jgi:serine/threonine-protein kinase